MTSLLERTSRVLMHETQFLKNIFQLVDKNQQKAKKLIRKENERVEIELCLLFEKYKKKTYSMLKPSQELYDRWSYVKVFVKKLRKVEEKKREKLLIERRGNVSEFTWSWDPAL